VTPTDGVTFYDSGASSASIAPLTRFDWRVIPFVIGETIIVLAAMWIGLMLRGIV